MCVVYVLRVVLLLLLLLYFNVHAADADSIDEYADWLARDGVEIMYAGVQFYTRDVILVKRMLITYQLPSSMMVWLEKARKRG